jgi:hypothetical protein
MINLAFIKKLHFLYYSPMNADELIVYKHIMIPFIRIFFAALISLSHILLQWLQLYTFEAIGLFIVPHVLQYWDVYASFTSNTNLL